MSRNIPALTLNYTAEGAIATRRLVKHGSADGKVAQASTNTDTLLGVSTDIPAEAGGRVDVIREGIVPVLYGGSITRGQPLTADAQGRAVAASSGQQVVGFAEVSGVEGDIGVIHLQRSALS